MEGGAWRAWEGYGRRSGGRGWGPQVLGPLPSSGLSRHSGWQPCVPRRHADRLRRMSLVEEGAVKRINMAHLCTPDLMLSMAWLASTRRSSHTHVRPAPQTPPLLLGPAHCLYWALRAALCWLLPQVAPLYKGHRCAIQSSPVLGCPLLHTAPSPPPRPHLQESFTKKLGRAPRRRPSFHRGD